MCFSCSLRKKYRLYISYILFSSIIELRKLHNSSEDLLYIRIRLDDSTSRCVGDNQFEAIRSSCLSKSHRFKFKVAAESWTKKFLYLQIYVYNIRISKLSIFVEVWAVRRESTKYLHLQKFNRNIKCNDHRNIDEKCNPTT
jgi:hypothetical protein